MLWYNYTVTSRHFNGQKLRVGKFPLFNIIFIALDLGVVFMLNEEIFKKLLDIGNQVADSKGFELVDMEFVKESGNWYLRYYIDKTGGVTLDDCQLISMELSKMLDEMDPIPYSYFLEVSSPGVERPLKKDKDFIKYIGSMVEIKTFEKIDGKKNFTGILKNYSNDAVTIEDGKTYSIPKDKISAAKLKFEWNEEQE